MLERPTVEASPPIMRLWAHYQQCLVTTDPMEFVFIIDQRESVVPARTEPLSWMRAWGQHVANQPLRMAIDPQALGAACTLRAAAVMAKAEHLMEARAVRSATADLTSARRGPSWIRPAHARTRHGRGPDRRQDLTLSRAGLSRVDGPDGTDTERSVRVHHRGPHGVGTGCAEVSAGMAR